MNKFFNQLFLTAEVLKTEISYKLTVTLLTQGKLVFLNTAYTRYISDFDLSFHKGLLQCPQSSLEHKARGCFCIIQRHVCIYRRKTKQNDQLTTPEDLTHI